MIIEGKEISDKLFFSYVNAIRAMEQVRLFYRGPYLVTMLRESDQVRRCIHDEILRQAKVDRKDPECTFTFHLAEAVEEALGY